MRITCVTSATDSEPKEPDVLVLPDQTTLSEVRLAQKLSPEAVVVAAVAEGDFIRGYLLHQDINRVNYLKTPPDGRSKGTGILPETPVYETQRVAVGMLICRDFQNAELRKNVMDKLLASAAEFKVLCIPADMGSQWFSNEHVADFPGVFLAVSNHRRGPNDTRRPSFIVGPDGAPRALQTHDESIYFHVP